MVHEHGRPHACVRVGDQHDSHPPGGRHGAEPKGHHLHDECHEAEPGVARQQRPQQAMGAMGGQPQPERGADRAGGGWVVGTRKHPASRAPKHQRPQEWCGTEGQFKATNQTENDQLCATPTTNAGKRREGYSRGRDRRMRSRTSSNVVPRYCQNDAKHPRKRAHFST